MVTAQLCGGGELVELRQLEYFLAIVDHGGLGKASEALYISQPSLSGAIRSLERELMVPLFHRTGRRLVPTSAGDELVPLARAVLENVVTVHDAMRRCREVHGGVLTIACMPEMSGEAVAAWASGFMEKFPAVRLDLTEVGTRQELVNAIAEGKAEVGFTVDTELRGDLTFVELGMQRLLLVRPPGRELAVSDDGTVPLSGISDLAMVLRRVSGQEEDEIRDTLAAQGVDIAVGATVPSRSAQLTFVRRSGLQAFLPLRMCVAAVDAGTLVYETEPMIQARFGVVHRAGTLAPTAQHFVAEVQSAVRQWNQDIDELMRDGCGLVEAALAVRDSAG